MRPMSSRCIKRKGGQETIYLSPEWEKAARLRENQPQQREMIVMEQPGCPKKGGEPSRLFWGNVPG